MPTINVITGPTVLIEYAGLRFLTDPTFDAPQDYDMGITVLKKTAGAPITPESVLPIDAVLLSHDTHPDNLDTSGRALLPKVGHVITTEDGEKNLQAEGLTNVTGLAPWSTFIVAKGSTEVTVTAMPALHGPNIPEIQEKAGPVIGFLLQAAGEPTVYISGDNSELHVVEEIAQRIAPVDDAILFAGAAHPIGPEFDMTMTAENTAKAAKLLGAQRVYIAHTDSWGHLGEDLQDTIQAFTREGIDHKLMNK